MNSGLQAWQQCFYLLRYFIGPLDIHFFFFKSCFYFVRNHFGLTSAAILAAVGS